MRLREGQPVRLQLPKRGPDPMAQLKPVPDALLAIPGPARRLRLPKPGPALCTVVLLVMGLVILYPVALLVYSSFLVPQPTGGNALGFGLWLTAWDQAGILEIHHQHLPARGGDRGAGVPGRDSRSPGWSRAPTCPARS